MKIIIISLMVLLTTTFVKAQTLNSNATFIKKNYPTEYEQIFKKYALAKWKNDFSMVLFEINKEADALLELKDEFESENTNIAFRAIKKWSKDGFEKYNTSLMNKMEYFNLENLVKMHCDWSMVKFEYEKQVKAKNAL